MKIVADVNIPFVEEAFDSVGSVTTVNGRRISADEVSDADVLLVRSVTMVDANLLQRSKVKFVGNNGGHCRLWQRGLPRIGARASVGYAVPGV